LLSGKEGKFENHEVILVPFSQVSKYLEQLKTVANIEPNPKKVYPIIKK